MTRAFTIGFPHQLFLVRSLQDQISLVTPAMVIKKTCPSTIQRAGIDRSAPGAWYLLKGPLEKLTPTLRSPEIFTESQPT